MRGVRKRWNEQCIFEIWLCTSHWLIPLNFNPYWYHFWEGVCKSIGKSLVTCVGLHSSRRAVPGFLKVWYKDTKFTLLFFLSFCLFFHNKELNFLLVSICCCRLHHQGICILVFIAVWPCYAELLISLHFELLVLWSGWPWDALKNYLLWVEVDM